MHFEITLQSLFTYGHIVCISLVVVFQVVYIQGILVFNTCSAVVYCIHHYFRSFYLFILVLCKRLIMINHIHNKKLCLHNMCVMCIFICRNTHTHILGEVFKIHFNKLQLVIQLYICRATID